MPKLHKQFAATNCQIAIDTDEYNYLVQCHALLQTILNHKGYDAGPAIETAKEILAELEENSADV